MVGFFIAHRPSRFLIFTTSVYESIFVPYKKWPSIAGHRIYPIWLVSLSSIWIAAIMHHPFWGFGLAVMWLLVGLIVLLFVGVGFLETVGGFLDTCQNFFEGNETIQMISGFLRAKKERMCWKIKIVKDEN